MRNHLSLLKANHPAEGRVKFSLEMDDFYSLFVRYLDEKKDASQLDWSKCKSPADDQVVAYADIDLHPANSSELLGKLAVLKLNGGLGTTMGCVGPKRLCIHAK
jgi:UTP--glucose-1-phosphate uridylyltransferase